MTTFQEGTRLTDDLGSGIGYTGPRVTSDATTANTKGAWVSLITPSATADGFQLFLNNGDANRPYLVDLGEGPTSDAVTPFWQNLPWNPSGGDAHWGLLVRHPVSNGNQLWARCQSSTTSSRMHGFAVAILGGLLGQTWSSIQTYGVATGTSLPFNVTPASSAPAWKELTTIGGITSAIDAFFVIINAATASQSLNGAYQTIEIGVGSPGSESIALPETCFGTNTGEKIGPHILGPFTYAAASATRFHARINTKSGATNNTGTIQDLGVSLIGVAYGPPPATTEGPWRIVGSADADPDGPGGANVLQSTDPLCTTVFAVGDEYDAYSETIIPLTGATAAQIDSGDLRLRLIHPATRMTGETADEIRIGVKFYDVSDVLISSSASDAIGTAGGLMTATWANLSRDFAIPTTARGFRARPWAIKRNTVWPHARVQFTGPVIGRIVLAQGSAFADTHASIYVEDFARAYAEFTDATLDVAALSKLEIDNSGKAGYFHASPTMTRLDWAREWLSDITALPYWNRAGLLSVLQIRKTTAANHTILAKHIAKSPVSIAAPNQHKARTLGYARNYTLQNADTLAGAVDATTKAFVEQQYRTVRKLAADVGIDTTQALGAIESRSDTYFADLVGATAEILRQLEMFAPNEGAWLIPLQDYQLIINPCDIASVTYEDPQGGARWKFGTAQLGIVLAVKEESAEGRSTISWWG